MCTSMWSLVNIWGEPAQSRRTAAMRLILLSLLLFVIGVKAQRRVVGDISESRISQVASLNQENYYSSKHFTPRLPVKLANMTTEKRTATGGPPPTSFSPPRLSDRAPSTRWWCRSCRRPSPWGSGRRSAGTGWRCMVSRTQCRHPGSTPHF